ncbi:DUF4235 domain-containing protein [Aeromicrobium sp. CF3.5]|uniref:DUF4235 domain-containing protein n=1 Tax=Aeromicrobium sp. CF3.5 TaxID=3373078 RepID=UPI003EE70760
MAKKKPKKSIDPDLAPRATKVTAGQKSAWKVLDRGSTIAGGLLSKRIAMFAWQGVTGRKPPVNGRHPDVGTAEAIAWAVVGGALVEVVRIGVHRGATSYWTRSTGELPPGMKPLKGSAAGAKVGAVVKK